jgi:hypothetical protein
MSRILAIESGQTVYGCLRGEKPSLVRSIFRGTGIATACHHRHGGYRQSFVFEFDESANPAKIHVVVDFNSHDHISEFMSLFPEIACGLDDLPTHLKTASAKIERVTEVSGG